MSNFGQAALTIVGTVVGASFGYPQLGLVVGSLAGQAIFPTRLPGVSGPRLSDARTTTAQVGAPVIEVIGTDAVPGNVNWMTPVREVSSTEEVGGKGGPSQEQTTYTYFQSFSVGICRGPMGGVIRIWENGKLVYDVRPQLDTESDVEYERRIEEALSYADGFTLYLGDEEQLPDPTIEADKGVGNVPAWRGLCYIVFPNRQLKEEQGLRIPNFKFEVTKDYVGTCNLEWSNEVLVFDENVSPPAYADAPTPPDPDDGWAASPGHVFHVLQQFSAGGGPGGSDVLPLNPTLPLGDPDFDSEEFWTAAYAAAVTAGTMAPGKAYGSDYPVEQDWAYVRGGVPEFEFETSKVYPWLTAAADPRNPLNRHEYMPTHDVSGSGQWYESLAEAQGAASNSTNDPVVPPVTFGPLGSNGHYSSSYNVQPWIMSDHGAPDGVYPPGQRQGRIDYSALSIFFNQFDPGSQTVVTVWEDSIVELDTLIAGLLTEVGQHHMVLDRVSDPTTTGWPTGVLIPEPMPAAGVTLGVGGTSFLSNSAWESYDYAILCRRWLVPPPTPEDGPEWTADETDRVWRFLGIYVVGDTNGVQSTPLGPARPTGHPEFNDEDFWTEAYNAAVIAGEMQPGLTYEIDYPQVTQGSQGFAPGAPGVPYARVYCDAVAADAGTVPLSAVIEHICGRVGIAPEEIDVSDHTATFIVGYTISRVMTARDAIEPLRNIGYFDVVESADLLKFVKRGKAIARTIDVDAFAYESGSDPGPDVTTRDLQETDLPRRVRVHYRAPSRDYEEGEQISPSRATAKAVNDLDLEVAAALPDDLAAQIAEVVWADSWEGRRSHEFTLDAHHIDIEIATVLALPVDGYLQRVRVSAIDDTIGSLRRIEAIRDFDGSYVSRAVADPPQRTPGTIVVLAPSEILFMDLPALRDVDNDPGVYATTRPVEPGATWKGATIYKSIDGGATFTSVAGVSSQATTGSVVAPIPAGDSQGFDERYVLDVEVQTGDFESRTDADLFAGANTIAVGAHERWELLQFANVEQLTPTRFRLSRLIRGRKGTEWAMGTMQAGDDVVLVSGQGIVRLPVVPAEIDSEITWKAVTFGMAQNTGVDAVHVSTGEALRPYSPIDIDGAVVENGDLVLSWLRRGRLGHELTSGAEIPLSEASESYEIDILAGSDIVRTLSSSTTTVTYTVAQQVEDFGPDIASVSACVYQMSAVVGRGHPGCGGPFLANEVEGSLEALPFVPAYDDRPLLLGTTSEGFIFARRGRKGEKFVVGFYFWPAGASPGGVEQFDDSYDGVGTNFFPSSYYAGAVLANNFKDGEGYPVHGFDRAQSEFSLYFRLVSGGSISSQKWLISGEGDEPLKIVPRDAVPLSSTSRGITALMPAGAGTIYALASQVSIAPTVKPDVYRSLDGGQTWAFVATTTGDLPPADSITAMRMFEHSGKVVLFSAFGNYVNAAGDLIDWDDQGGTPTSVIDALRDGDPIAAVIDIDYTATEIMVLGFSAESFTSEGGYVGQKNKIARSTDGGATWTLVRDVPLSTDTPPAAAHPLQWTLIRRLGAGYVVYGRALTAFAFPYALISTDGGVTFGTPQAVDTGDETANAVIVSALSDGSTIFAIDTRGRRTFNGSNEFDALATPVIYGRLVYSVDGLTFSALPGFPTGI